MTDSSIPSSAAGLELFTPAQLVDALNLRKVLLFAAHPDDVDFGAAATVAGLSALGVEAEICVLTSGDAGGFDTTRSAQETAALREEEQREAARTLGVPTVTFLPYRDGYLTVSDALVRDLVEQIRRVRPDAIFSCHPERAWDRMQKSHPDHLVCGEAVVRACYPFVENPFAFPELSQRGLEAFKVRHLLLYGSPAERARMRVDVSGLEEAKLQALSRHFSQYDDVEQINKFIRAELRAQHPNKGSAEAFHHVVINDERTISGF